MYYSRTTRCTLDYSQSLFITNADTVRSVSLIGVIEEVVSKLLVCSFVDVRCTMYDEASAIHKRRKKNELFVWFGSLEVSVLSL